MKSSETLYIGGDIQIDMNGTYTHIFGGGYSEFKPEVSNPDSIKYYYYTKDHLGNIRNVLLNDNGTMTELQHHKSLTPRCILIEKVNRTNSVYKSGSNVQPVDNLRIIK